MRMCRWMSWPHISSFQPLFRVKWVQWPNRFMAEFWLQGNTVWWRELRNVWPEQQPCIHIYLLTSLTVYWTVPTVTILAYLFVFTFFSVNVTKKCKYAFSLRKRLGQEKICEKSLMSMKITCIFQLLVRQSNLQLFPLKGVKLHFPKSIRSHQFYGFSYFGIKCKIINSTNTYDIFWKQGASISNIGIDGLITTSEFPQKTIYHICH